MYANLRWAALVLALAMLAGFMLLERSVFEELVLFVAALAAIAITVRVLRKASPT